MTRKITMASAALAVFLAGSYAEGRYHITPAVTAAFRTAKAMAGDLYAGVLARIPGEIETTSAFFALAGVLALLSFKFLARARKM